MPVWPMREGGRIVERMLSGSLLANNAETLRRMAIAGTCCVTSTPRRADHAAAQPD